MTVTPMSTRSAAFLGSRTAAMTSSPRVRRTRTTALPTKPVAPEIQIRRWPVLADGAVTGAIASGVAGLARARGRFGVVAGLGSGGGFGLLVPRTGPFGAGAAGLVRRVRGRGSVMGVPPPGDRSVDRGLGADGLEPRLDVAQERGAAGAVVRAVIDPEDHVHDRPDADVVALWRLDHDGPLRDPVHGHDPDLGHVNDRHDHVRAEPARVVDRERAAAEVVDVELAGPGSFGNLGDGPVEAVDRQVVDIADDRDDQPVVQRDRDPDVDPALGQEALLSPVGIERRIALQRLRRGLDHERDEAERQPLARLVVALVLLPEA